MGDSLENCELEEIGEIERLKTKDPAWIAQNLARLQGELAEKEATHLAMRDRFRAIDKEKTDRIKELKEQYSRLLSLHKMANPLRPTECHIDSPEHCEPEEAAEIKKLAANGAEWVARELAQLQKALNDKDDEFRDTRKRLNTVFQQSVDGVNKVKVEYGEMLLLKKLATPRK